MISYHIYVRFFFFMYICISVYACFKFTHLHYIISKQCINKQTHTYIYGDQRLADIASMDERNDRELLLQSELLKCLKVVNSSIKYILLLDNVCVCVCVFFFCIVRCISLSISLFLSLARCFGTNLFTMHNNDKTKRLPPIISLELTR
jgi:hypothetical protein